MRAITSAAIGRLPPPGCRQQARSWSATRPARRYPAPTPDAPGLASTHLRIARPSRDLAKGEAFWIGGLGLTVLHQARPGRRRRARLAGGWMAQRLPGTWNWPAIRPTRPHPPLPRKTCSSSTSAPPSMRRRSSAWHTRADRSSPDISPTGSAGESLSPTPAATGSSSVTRHSSEQHRLRQQTPTRPRSQPRCRRTEPEKTEQADRRAHHSEEIASTQDTYSASICCRTSDRALPRHSPSEADAARDRLRLSAQVAAATGTEMLRPSGRAGM